MSHVRMQALLGEDDKKNENIEFTVFTPSSNQDQKIFVLDEKSENHYVSMPADDGSMFSKGVSKTRNLEPHTKINKVKESKDLLKTAVQDPLIRIDMWRFMLFVLAIVLVPSTISKWWETSNEYNDFLDTQEGLLEEYQHSYDDTSCVSAQKNCSSVAKVTSISDFDEYTQCYFVWKFTCGYYEKDDCPTSTTNFTCKNQCCDVVKKFFALPNISSHTANQWKTNMIVAASISGAVMALEILSAALAKKRKYCFREPQLFFYRFKSHLADYLSEDEMVYLRNVAEELNVTIVEGDILLTIRNFEKAYSKLLFKQDFPDLLRTIMHRPDTCYEPGIATIISDYLEDELTTPSRSLMPAR